jgi:hypothetical protein
MTEMSKASLKNKQPITAQQWFYGMILSLVVFSILLLAALVLRLSSSDNTGLSVLISLAGLGLCAWAFGRK